MPCPYCGQSVYDDAERCPHCENYLSEEDAPAQRPWWLLPGVLVCLLLAVGWALLAW
jgi:hypothetical protein